MRHPRPPTARLRTLRCRALKGNGLDGGGLGGEGLEDAAGGGAAGNAYAINVAVAFKAIAADMGEIEGLAVEMVGHQFDEGGISLRIVFFQAEIAVRRYRVETGRDIDVDVVAPGKAVDIAKSDAELEDGHSDEFHALMGEDVIVDVEVVSQLYAFGWHDDGHGAVGEFSGASMRQGRTDKEGLKEQALFSGLGFDLAVDFGGVVTVGYEDKVVSGNTFKVEVIPAGSDSKK